MAGTPFSPKGQYTIFDIDEKTGLWLPLFSADNQIQLDWAVVACQTIGLGKSEYKISAMYVEYENVNNPNDPVSIPSYSRGEGREYYESLSGNRDYLRVPLLSQPRLSVQDTNQFSGQEDDFDTLTFFSQTSGSVGIKGRPFSHLANSKVCGIALVATPSWEDRTRDRIFGRAYFSPPQQILKEASHQIGVSWRQTFE